MSDNNPSDDAHRILLEELAKVSSVRLAYVEEIALMTEEEWDRAIAWHRWRTRRYVEPRSIVIPEDGTQE